MRRWLSVLVMAGAIIWSAPARPALGSFVDRPVALGDSISGVEFVGGPHQQHANGTQEHSQERGRFLRYEIGILALVIIGLEVIFSLSVVKALRLLRGRQSSAALPYLLGGVAGIIGCAVVGFLAVSFLLE